MVAITSQTPQLFGEKRVMLRDLTWQAYQQILHGRKFTEMTNWEEELNEETLEQEIANAKAAWLEAD